jgi:HEAT repeat protein
VIFRRAQTITYDAALRDIVSADVRARVGAADALGDVPEGADRAAAAGALAKACSDARFEVRRSAALALGELGSAAPIDPLVGLLGDEHPEVRQAAAIALGRLGDERAFEPLAQALRDGPPDVRFQAAASLVEIDAERAYDPLCAAIHDGDAEVRGNVAAALAFIGDRRAVGWIAELLEDGSLATRFEAACALARLGDARAVDQLIGSLDGAPERAYAALEGLETIGDPRALAPLARLMRKLLAPRAVRVRAAGVLLHLGGEGADASYARDLLAKGARSSRPDVRGLAEEALERLKASEQA